MKKSRLLGLILAVVLMVTCVPVSAFAEGESKSQIVDAAYSVVVDEEAGTVEEHAYKVYLPVGYSEDNSYPTIYLMPQDGYASKQYVDDGIQARLDELMSSGSVLPMVVVMPDFAEGDDYSALLPEIVADVEAEYSVIADTNFRALLGVGVGGYMAFETALISKTDLFKAFGSHMGDFTSEANPYLAKGSVMDTANKLGGLSRSTDYFYIDGPNKDAFTTVSNGTSDIGGALEQRTNPYYGTSYYLYSTPDVSKVEFNILDGDGDAAYYLKSMERSLNRFSARFTGSLFTSSLTCTPQAVTSSDATTTATVKFTMNDNISLFAAELPEVKITVTMSDPADGKVLYTASEVLEGLEAGVEKTQEFVLDTANKADGVNTTISATAEFLGMKQDLASLSLVAVQDTGTADNEQQVDLMGNWYFQAYKNYKRNDTTVVELDRVENAVAQYKNWETVQPGLGWWTNDFAPSLNGQGNFGGYAWYIRTFDMPANFPKDGLLLGVGKFDEANEVYINGNLVGSNGMNFTDGVGFYDGSNPWDVNNVYELPSEFLKYGEENIIAVRMCNSSGGGGWYEGPIGVYSQAAYNKAYGKASVYAPEDVQEAVLALVEKQIAAIEAEDIDAYAATLDVDYFESGFDKERRLDQMKAWFEAYDNLDVEDDVTGVFEEDGLYNYQAVRKFTGTDAEGNKVDIIPANTEGDTIDENNAYEVSDYYAMNGKEAVGYGSHSRFFYDSYVSEVKGGEQTFRVYLPEGYFDADNAKRYPTMFLLHGINSQSKTFVLDKIDQMVEDAIAAGEMRETIVIIPDEPKKANGGWNADMITKDLLPTVDERYRTIDDERYRYVGGCSMGGGGAFSVGLLNPDAFSGVISFYGYISIHNQAQAMSKEYLDQYGLVMVCGNQDMYNFYTNQEKMSRIFFEKDVDHYHYVDIGGHDSVFYLPQFMKSVKYIESKAYTTDGKAVDGAEGTVAAAAVKDGVKVDYTTKLPADVLGYLNTVYYTDGSASVKALNVPVEIRVVQDGVVVASATDVYELGPVKAKAKAAITFENSLELASAAFDADKEYTVNVYASVLEDTELVASKTVEPVKAPAKVKNVKAELAAYNSIKVSWDKSADATEYLVYYKRDFVENYTAYKKVTGTSVTLKGLYTGVKYNIKVVPVNNGVKGPESAVKSVTTLKKVTGVKVVRNGKKVTVSWTNINGETGYQISRAIKDVKANITTHKGANLTKATITLTENPGKRYYYVRAYKEVNGKKVFGPWSAKVYK